jgi:hypothetical protein
MKRLILMFGAALALSGCSTMPGGETATAAVAAAADVLTGPDTDYTNYLRHCGREVTAQREAAQAESKALEAGIGSQNEKIQFASLVLLAAKTGNSLKIGCSVSRKKGFTELLLENSNIVDAGIQLYRENRDQARFQKKLEADKELALERMRHDRLMLERQNDLLTTLSGDKLELQRDARGASTAEGD